ncbi:MAG: gas vesicle protein GvpG [Thermoleophilaceae bacterium]|jgi:Gas vesicle protein G
MGLITGLLLLPLAPVRGTVWLAERIQEQAEAEMYDESAIRTGLLDLEAAREAGEFSEEEIDAAENALLERLMVLRGLGPEETVYGTVE